MIADHSITLADRRSATTRGADVPFALTWEVIATVFTVGAVVFLPLLVPRGAGNTAPVDLLVGAAVAAVVLWMAVAHGEWRFPYAIAIGLFALGGALGALAGPVPQAGIVALLQDGVLVAWCWALVAFCRSPRRTLIVIRAWAYSSVAWAILLFVGLATGTTALTGQTDKNATRTALTFVDPNVSANYYFISIMLIWASGYPRRREYRIAAYALLLAAIVSTGSNSGMVSVAVGMVVAVVLGIYRRSGAAPAVAAGAAVLVAATALSATVSMKSIQDRAGESRWSFVREGIGRSDVSVQQREMLKEESLRLYATGGFLGEGPVSTKTRLERDAAPFVKEAHDDYFAALIERGAIGLLGLLLLVAGIAIRALAVGQARSAQVLAAFRAPHALAGASAGTLVAMTVYELLHVRHVWALFAFVAAAYLWDLKWQRPTVS